MDLNGTGWMYFKSHHIEPGHMKEEIHGEKVKHRLYLTVDEAYRPLMAQRIIEKCEEQKSPYNFKVFVSSKKHQYNQQSDTMVMYLENDEQVVQYVNFLNEIIEKNPELAEHIHRPSPHLGIVNEFIGYGFEPNFKINGQMVSYSQFMQDVVRKTYNKSPRMFNSFTKGILESIRDNDVWYFQDAKDYCLYNPNYPSENLYLPSQE